jgi:hypothetical protein
LFSPSPSACAARSHSSTSHLTPRASPSV